MDRAQFDEPQRAQVMALLETLPWGDVEREIGGLEVALALAIEATGDAIQLWEEEGEEVGPRTDTWGCASWRENQNWGWESVSQHRAEDDGVKRAWIRDGAFGESALPVGAWWGFGRRDCGGGCGD